MVRIVAKATAKNVKNALVATIRTICCRFHYISNHFVRHIGKFSLTHKCFRLGVMVKVIPSEDMPY